LGLLGMAWTGHPAALLEGLPRRRVRAGQPLVVDQESAKAVYLVRTGTFKTIVIDCNGQEQIVGFPMTGDMIGVDAFNDGHHQASVYALEDADVIVLSLVRLAELAKRYPGFEQLVYRSMARALVREQKQVWTLGVQCAHARLAEFLLGLARRYADAGYSGKAFRLRMSRQDMASHLGLTIETVSRTLSAMHKLGLINVDGREIELKDADELKRLAFSGDRTPLRKQSGRLAHAA
jgi:CRP/FNR family transcriptional regulator, anaerobic regulatory protein